MTARTKNVNYLLRAAPGARLFSSCLAIEGDDFRNTFGSADFIEAGANEALPLIKYPGRKIAGSAEAFLRKHYAVWLQKKTLDQATLERWDKPLLDALRNERRNSGRSASLKDLLTAVATAREGQLSSNQVALRRSWRGSKKKARQVRK